MQDDLPFACTLATVRVAGNPLELAYHPGPVGNQAAFHLEAERAVARAARSTETLQILSTVANTAVEDVIEHRDGPVWFQ